MAAPILFSFHDFVVWLHVTERYSAVKTDSPVATLEEAGDLTRILWSM